MHYEELSSTKYIEPLIKQRRRMFRRERNAKALQDFITFLFGLGLIYLGIWVVQHMEIWRPKVEQVWASLGF